MVQRSIARAKIIIVYNATKYEEHCHVCGKFIRSIIGRFRNSKHVRHVRHVIKRNLVIVLK